MSRRTKIAIIVCAVIALVAGIFVCLHHPPQTVRKNQRPVLKDFVGVGVALRVDPQSGCFVINDVLSGMPAAKAGITRGTIVSKVDDEPLEGKSLPDCVNLIRGAVGTTVRLELITADRSQTNTIELTRAKY